MKKTVLIVEDDEQTAKLYKQVVELKEHVVLTSSNGPDAIRQYVKHHPDLVLMDVDIPILNGCKAIEQIKEIVKIPEHSSGTKISWFVYVVCLPDVTPEGIRNEILSELTKKGIGCNNYFPPIHLQPFYQVEFGYKREDYPITESISKRTIALPFHNNLTNAEIIYIVDILKELFEQKKIPLNGLSVS